MNRFFNLLSFTTLTKNTEKGKREKVEKPNTKVKESQEKKEDYPLFI